MAFLFQQSKSLAESWLKSKKQNPHSIFAACSATVHTYVVLQYGIKVFRSEFIKDNIATSLCKLNLSLSGKVSDHWHPAGSACPAKSAWRMGDMSCMPMLALFDRQRVCDGQAMFLMYPSAETAITPRGCFQSSSPIPLAAQTERSS